MLRLKPYIAALLLASCSSLPFAGGPVDILPVTPDAPAQWVAARVDGEIEQTNWLTDFNDSQVEDLVKEALENSPTINAQLALLDAARATVRTAAAELFPKLNGSVQGGQVSSVRVNPLGVPVRTDESTYGFSLTASWEPDVIGRLSKATRAVLKDYSASEKDYEAVRLSVTARVAIAWLNLKAAIASEQLSRENLLARQKTVALTSRRFEGGITRSLDIRTARASQAQAEAQIARRQQATLEAARTLESLLGRYPAAEINAVPNFSDLAPLKPSGNPALLLSSRPDIVGLEARVEVAGIQAELARLAILPSLSLQATASSQEDVASNAFDPDYIAGRAIANLVVPIFNGGARLAQYKTSLARARAAVANYASGALNAWREVENAIAADSLLEKQLKSEALALDEAIEGERYAIEYFQNGLISVFDLISAQTQRINAESALISAQTQRAINRVNYYHALGILPSSVEKPTGDNK